MTDYEKELDKIAEMLGYYQRDGGWFQPQAPDYWNKDNDLDVTNVMSSLNSLLRRVEIEERKGLVKDTMTARDTLKQRKCKCGVFETYDLERKKL